jgi:hypothetical protein
MYGSENRTDVWGFENNSIISQFQLKFYKYILKHKISTPSVMVIRELGAFPIENDITCRMLNFWIKTDNGKNDKICVFCIALCIIFMKRVFYIVSGLRK